MVLGPVLGGLVGQVSVQAPFWLAAGLALANGFYGLFVLRESLTSDRRAPFRAVKANPFGAARFLLSHRVVAGLVVVYFLDQLASFPLNSILVLYTHDRYRWGPGDVGVVLTTMALAARIGERAAVILGFGCAAVGLCILGLAPSGSIFWLGLSVTVLSAVANPALQALLTRAVGASEQGELQGAMSGLLGVSRLIGPLVFTTTFAWSMGAGRGLGLPGLAIVLGAVFFVIGMGVMVFQGETLAPRSGERLL
jgi:DHA1 family tetracycline resistance protein-like MFS transporter